MNDCQKSTENGTDLPPPEPLFCDHCGHRVKVRSIELGGYTHVNGLMSCRVQDWPHRLHRHSTDLAQVDGEWSAIHKRVTA